jgi:hypothetical protein
MSSKKLFSGFKQFAKIFGLCALNALNTVMGGKPQNFVDFI